MEISPTLHILTRKNHVIKSNQFQNNLDYFEYTHTHVYMYFIDKFARIIYKIS